MNGGALVLAAGASERFGSDKRKYRVDGRPLLQRTVEQVHQAGLACRVCLRPGDGDIPLLLGIPGIEFIECASAAQGMGSTLAEGVRACPDWEGLLVVLGDMAWVRPDTLLGVFTALTADTLVQPVCNGKPGHPVGFGKRFFPELAALSGDRGGRALLQRHAGLLREVTVDDPGIHRDLDRPPGEGG